MTFDEIVAGIDRFMRLRAGSGPQQDTDDERDFARLVAAMPGEYDAETRARYLATDWQHGPAPDYEVWAR